MIHIKKKQDCCGCAACVQVCPKQCIEMRADNEGFFYPKVCTVNCINCDLCEKVCPVINKNESRVPVNTVAAINTDENVRMKSSSGGIFSLLAKIVIEQDGVVFGVRFDNEWNVIHDYIDKEEDLDHFCGSKYVQSHIGNAFSQVRSYLQAGRMVLFSGTPCQVAGLYKYLRKDYGNLVTVDFGNDKINGLYMNIPHITMYDRDNYDTNHDYSTSGNIYELIEDMGLTSGDAFRATYKPLFPANVYIPYTLIRLYMNAYDGNTFSNHTEDSYIDFYYINNNHNMRHIDIFSNTTTCVLSSDATVSNIYPLRDLDDFTLGYFSQDYPITIYSCISNCVNLESYLYTSLYLSLKL